MSSSDIPEPSDDVRGPEDPLVTAGRDVVANLYGAAVADKATARFLAAHATPARREVGLGGFLAMAAPRRGAMTTGSAGTVLTFARSKPAPPALEAVERVRSQLQTAGPVALPALRQALVRARREAAYGRMGAVYAEVERLSERAWTGPGAAQQSGPLTEVCWLSRSLRTHVDPLLVADAAADPDVVAIDLPERLRREAAGAPDVVGAVAARQRLGASGRGVLVAVIDGEVAHDHPAFGGRIVHRRNHTRELWGSPDGHGTAVAGIIGAAAPGDGMAVDCEMYCYKVFATVSVLSSDRFDGERALQAALEDGVQVANCSWAAEPPRPGQPATLEEAVNDAWEAGMVVVKSAGNQGRITHPGDADGILVVGTTTPDGGTIPPESGRNGSRPHVVAPGGAPGQDVGSTLVGGGVGPVGWGTSFAAPVVTGAVALLLERNPAWSPDEVRRWIVDAAAPLGGSRRLDLSAW